MRYADIIKNDIMAAPGISLSVYLQGCPHHCPGCHNPETWDFEGGKEFTYDTLTEIFEGIKANGLERSLSILGGEPLCPENQFLTNMIISEVRKRYPDIKIYVWTGYLYEELLKNSSKLLEQILASIDVLIDGPFIESERDITLPLRGSRNQKIIDLSKKI